MSDNGAIPLPPIEPHYIDGLVDQVRQERLAKQDQKLPRLRLWLYRVMFYFRLGNIKAIYLALARHKTAIDEERRKRAQYKALAPEAKTFAKLLKHNLALLGFSDVERIEGRRRLRKTIKFRLPIYVDQSRIYLQVLTSSQTILGSAKSEMPYKSSATKLEDPETIRHLELTLNRKIDVVFKPQKGLWYIIHRTEDLSGLPRLVPFEHMLQFFEPGLPVICLGVTLHRHVKRVKLGQVPHALIAGQTGSGKSVMLNNILSGLIRFNLPADLKLLIIDLKGNEFFDYFKLDRNQVFLPGQSIPHLAGPVVCEPAAALTTLKQVLALIKLRYKRMAGRARNIDDYNRRRSPETRMPRLIVIIDELAELLLDTDSKRGQEAERYLLRIAQLGRAAGVHVICGTQRPSREIVTPNIHANLDLKFSGRMGRQYDSMTVLGTGDAAELEAIPGRACYKIGPDVIKVQPPLIETPEIMKSVGIALSMPGHELRLPGADEADSMLADDARLIDYEAGLVQMLTARDGKLGIHDLMHELGISQGEASLFQKRVSGTLFEHDGEPYQVEPYGKTLRIVHATRMEKNGMLRYLQPERN